MNKCAIVRESCSRVVSKSKNVKINQEMLEKFCYELIQENQNGKLFLEYSEYDCHLSLSEAPAEDVIGYTFILDSLNFCFWPCEGFEYENMAGNLKALYLSDKTLFSPERILKWTKELLKDRVFGGLEFPLLGERLRILHEVAERTIAYFDGSFANIIKKAGGSAVKLLDLLTSFFNNFQDHAIYEGEQVCFYKRSQILIGDLWGVFREKEFGSFSDIEEITTFPDYRIPQLLNSISVMEYSHGLQKLIDEKGEIAHGGAFECEIRAATVECVERIKTSLAKNNLKVNSVQVDWILWQMGEKKKDSIRPHHRTLSIFY